MSLVVVACTSSATLDRADASDASPDPTVEALSAPTATPVPTPSPTSTPQPTPTPEPTATPVPTPTPDPSPVVLSGDDWTITENEVADLVAFIEEFHELEFRRDVRVESDDDIGAGFAEGLEIFAEDDWAIIELLGLVDDGVTRDAVNQARRDRIRGVCCDEDDESIIVILEPRATELETKVIVVHELVHALHRDHSELIGRPGRSGGFELPSTYTATFESIAQLVAFAYLETQPEDQQAAIADELPVVDDELGRISGRVPGEMLDFSYFTAPFLAEAVYAERGAAGLSDLLGRPPTTTEQIIYPERWLAGEDRVSQQRPEIPRGAQLLDEGRIGVAVMGWMLEEVLDAETTDELLRAWTGDRWARYRNDGRECLAAIAEFDSVEVAEQVAESLGGLHPSTAMAADEPRFTFDTCKPDQSTT